ncbi:hypothetical protein FA13DRAFT_164640 [Coprinellus micaceus]|uniref:Uncharacterized protein n=1 Tax=Coprinellus micaceus TaxID=71717 RepID=A0A4Y7SIT2_COPMI|nr:hypothetical protein FA13DRAFT_164640 [Coprinellus micaceus]
MSIKLPSRVYKYHSPPATPQTSARRYLHPTIMFDHPTKSVLNFNGNQFSQIFQNHAPPTPHDGEFGLADFWDFEPSLNYAGPNPRVMTHVKRDSRLNGYSDDAATIRVPRLTFDPISCLPEVSVEEPRLPIGKAQLEAWKLFFRPG